ncbi:MAG TPA: hypothetical protein PLP89_05490 [Synergistales bacterium]|jgi:hypothetical protein|nr:hypothetical protein [Synergistales bacterium]
MTAGDFFLKGNTELKRHVRDLSGRGSSPIIQQEWLRIAEEASLAGDWLLCEYAWKKGLGLRVLW